MFDIQKLDFREVILGVHQELQQGRSAEVGYGFELFRRAISEQDNRAWDALYVEYNGLIHYWIARISPISEQDRDDITQDTWLNFNSTLCRIEGPLAHRFPHVGALLKYLKKCVFTATLQHQQRRQRYEQVHEELGKRGLTLLSVHDKDILDQVYEQQRVEAVQKWRESYVHDPQEQLVLDCCFQEGLMPREIVAAYPEHFPNTKAVRRIRDRLMKRARRYFN